MAYDILDWQVSGSIARPDRRHPEWIVNRIPLARLLASADPDVPAANFSGPPVVLLGKLGAIEIERLTLREPSDLMSGRLALITCPVCGDKGCGYVSATVERTDIGFVWRDIGWERDVFGPEEPDLYEFRTYPGIGPFTFEPGPYERVMWEMNVVPVGAWRP